MILVRRVVGHSMEPMFRPGQLIVFRKKVHKLCAGDIIIFRHNGLEKIKRVSRLDNGKIFLLGDNPGGSTDSRHFGWIGATMVVGKVLWPRKLSN